MNPGLVAGLLVGITAILSGTTVRAAELTGFDLQFINDGNPARAELERDIEEASSVRARVTGSLASWVLANSDERASGFAITALGSYEHNLDIDGLGESRYRIGLGYFSENKLSTTSPFFRVGAGLSYLDSETQIRDSVLLDALISLNLQPTSFFDTTVGLGVEVRDGDTLVFDTTKGQLFLTANFAPVARLVLRTGIRYVFGDEVSTATPTVNIVNTAEEIEPDAAFGGIADNRFAYLVNANSTIFEVGIGYDFSAALQGNLIYKFVDTEADGDIGYDRGLLEFTLSYNL